MALCVKQRNVNTQPLVSIRIVTYNHEDYIAQCLEGILMQRADFPFEVIVGEHSSSDRTQEIALAYQEKYPDKIRVLITERAAKPMQNAIRVHQTCRGKYHAFCDGDDYWIDPLKLQKQVDFMEAHPEVSLCFHNAFIIREDIFGVRLPIVTQLEEVLTFEKYIQQVTFLPTSSIVARSDVLATLPEWRVNVQNSDRLLQLWCAHHGHLGYLNEIMSVYRKRANGLSATMSRSKKEKLDGLLYLYREFDKATQYQHTDLVQVLIRGAVGSYQRERWGAVYYLLHPIEWLKRLRRTYVVLKRYKNTLYI